MPPDSNNQATTTAEAAASTASPPTDSQYQTITLEELRREEGRLITARRRKAGVTDGNDDDSPPRDLVGLALSGGGVRSSMFNTGVLQGLQKMGLLKHVDYLATVSGGGFIGGFLTSQYNTHEGKFPLEEDDDGQNSSVNQLTRAGGYLNGRMELTLRVVAGATLHLLIIVAILAMTCSLLSWTWRFFDMSLVQWCLAQAATRLDARSWWWRGSAIIGGVSLPYLIYYSPHLILGTVEGRWLKRKLATWLILVGLALGFIASEGGFFAIHRDWFAMSDLVRALLPLGGLAYLLGFLDQLNAAAVRARGTLGDPEVGLVARLLRYKNLALTVGLSLSILTFLANGDTDLGPRISDVLKRLFPSMGSEAAASQVSVRVRNSETIRQWLSTITQYLLFIQLFSGVIPLLLPRQFAASGQADAGGFHRVVYRGIIFLLFVSLPLAICFIFLHENISGATQAPSPIKRLAVSRDPVTGEFGYLIDHDQWTRFRWFLAGLLGFVALNWTVDLNRTSLHQYYRRRLKAAFFDAFPSGRIDRREPDGHPETRLREIDIGKSGAPYPLLVATLNEIRPGTTSLDSGCAFILAPLYCGWSRNQPIGGLREEITNQPRRGTEPPEHQSCFIKTEAYGANDANDPEKANPGLRLVDAMAVSGAAITPSNSRSILDTILMLAANARLGQWLVNPEVGTRNARNPNDDKEIRRREGVFQRLLDRRGHGIPSISPWRLMLSVLKSPGGGREFCFLSDGAHYDNLGLEVLFERRCRLIIAADASHDPHYEFGDLSKVLRRLRSFRGIEFFLDRGAIEGIPAADKLVPWDLLGPADFAKPAKSGATKADIETPLCRSHHLVLAFRHPPAAARDESQRWGLLVVVKPSLDGEEDRRSAGLFSYARLKKTFPMDADLNQFFDENQCEYYRELGEHAASSILVERLKPESRPSLDDIMNRSIRKPSAVDRESTEGVGR